MTGNNQESIQWLSVTEDTLFLHDGLIRVTDLVELPHHDVNSTHDGENEVVTFDSKSPAELAAKLISVCGTHNNAYSRLLEYRLNALRGYWSAHQRIVLDELLEREVSTQEETIAVLKKQGLWKETEQAAFSTRVGLLLVLPLLQSQSKFDSSLCGVTAELLFNCLRDCPPLSLSKEPNDCLNGLENLLCSWLEDDAGTGSESPSKPSTIQKENTALALVALACARYK
jgi:E3 ubiquitin-protein ligase HECTD4